jgi:hypothetical protein
MLEERRERVVCEVIHRLIVNIMLDLKEAVRLDIGLVDGRVPDVLTGLDKLRVIHQVALGVEIEVNNVVT